MTAKMTNADVAAELVATYARLRGLSSLLDLAVAREAAAAAMIETAASTALGAAFRLDSEAAEAAARSPRGDIAAQQMTCHGLVQP
jgi:hypothetical protein